MAGLDLARWGHPEIAIYGNGMYRSAGLGSMAGSITNLGAHLQYHLFYPGEHASKLLFLWSGVHLTAGVEWSKWAFELGDSLGHDFDVDGDIGSTTITADATGTFTLDASSLTVPIELTTSARIAYFAGIYAGVGLDIQSGTAKADATLSATLDGTDPRTGDRVGVGTAAISMNGENGPASLAWHVLLGVEANLWRLKTFVQATVVPVDGASVALGVRLRL